MSKSFTARVLATAALVLFAFVACTPADSAPAPEPRTLQSAEVATRSGDLGRLRNDLGKGEGLARLAGTLADKLAPDVWLVALGAADREYDLKRILEAIDAGDDAALRKALGFGDQALAGDILSGGSSIHTRRANGRNYYESGPQPLDLVGGAELPALPEGCLAMHVSLWGKLEDRNFRLRYGYDQAGVTDLQALPELAGEGFAVSAGTVRFATAAESLPQSNWGLDVSSLDAEHWYGADFSLVQSDGTLLRIKLVRDDRGWARLEHSTSTQSERLGALRDKRLGLLGRRATDYLRTSGRWPRRLNELSWQPVDLCDPASGTGRPGWGDYAETPPRGLELAPDAESSYAARCTELTARGYRAVTHDGSLVWLQP